MECFPVGGWRLRDGEDEDLHEGYEEVVLACCVAVWLAGCDKLSVEIKAGKSGNQIFQRKI